MLGKIWAFMILTGIVVSAVTGCLGSVGISILDSSKEAVNLCITMLGIMAMWNGIINIADKAGIITRLTEMIRPVLKLLFPDIPRDHVVNEYIASNMISNVLGLGWAATPAGLMAMKELKKLNNNSKVASVDMCTFLIINMSSLQLVPVNVIAYRSQYGSVSPSGILLAGIIATTCSTVAGTIFALAAGRAG